MALPNAEKLLALVEKGETISAEQRRHVIGYLMAVKPTEAGTADLAELFGTTDRAIRRDKQIIREEKAAMLKEDDIGLVIADIRIQYENQIRDLEKGKKKCEVGSRNHLDYCKAIMDIELRVTKALQDLGYYPKNLGTQTINNFEWKAEVSRDGSVQTRQVREGEKIKTIDAEIVTDSKDQELRRQFEEEFADRPQLPAPADVKNEASSVRTEQPTPPE